MSRERAPPVVGQIETPNGSFGGVADESRCKDCEVRHPSLPLLFAQGMAQDDDPGLAVKMIHYQRERWSAEKTTRG